MSTPSNIIYGGVTPLYLDVQTRMILFWVKLVNGTIENKLSSTVYRVIYEMYAARSVV